MIIDFIRKYYIIIYRVIPALGCSLPNERKTHAKHPSRSRGCCLCGSLWERVWRSEAATNFPSYLQESLGDAAGRSGSWQRQGLLVIGSCFYFTSWGTRNLSLSKYFPRVPFIKRVVYDSMYSQ